MDKREWDRFRARVEKLAYELWEKRGRPSGSPKEDWFRAERQLWHHFGGDPPAREW